MNYRTEKDTMGEIKVEESKYWGAQTQRSLENFKIGTEKMPLEVIYGLALVKKAAALANSDLNLIEKEKSDLIVKAVDEIISGKFDSHFPLSVWQTGSGTQTNMNVNEVISNRASELFGSLKGSKIPVHPNDDVNHSQSSNDTFPTAMHIATVFAVHQKLIPSLKLLHKELIKKSEEFQSVIKVGRTHLMDATPITFGQEFSGYAAQIQICIDSVENALTPLYELALGGTAVGTGINAHPEFSLRAIKYLAEFTKFPFINSLNKFASLASHEPIVQCSSSLRLCAVALLKIVNDIRWMGSGPRCGISELFLPENEPGSSIMPGKVNPTQCEAISMVCSLVIGNDVSIGLSGSQGNFELNVYKPVLIYQLLQSIRLLSDGCENFVSKCLVGIRPNYSKVSYYLENSLMLATVLNESLGYEKSAAIVKKAYQEGISLKNSALTLGLLSEEEFEKIVDPKKMI
jgi:fumarate hydratase class II